VDSDNPGPVQAVNQTHEKINVSLTERWLAVTWLLIPVLISARRSWGFFEENLAINNENSRGSFWGVPLIGGDNAHLCRNDFITILRANLDANNVQIPALAVRKSS
jgi:hypothetical protein